MREYILLWKAGRLVSQQNNFPAFETKKQQVAPGPELFKIQVDKIVMRFKVRKMIIYSIFCLIRMNKNNENNENNDMPVTTDSNFLL